MSLRCLFHRTRRPSARMGAVLMSGLALAVALSSSAPAATTPWQSAQITHNLVNDWHPQVSANWVVW